MITKFKIINVKGYGVNGKEIFANIDPCKINLCVAPNGFGKSSLTAAINSLTQTTLNVPKEYKHDGDENAASSLTITIDGVDYTANKTKNEIYSQIRPYVINNHTSAGYKKRNFGGANPVSSFLQIDDIFATNIVKKPTLQYKYSQVLADFGNNSYLLSNIPNIFDDVRFARSLEVLIPLLEKFKQKGKSAIINSIVQVINGLSGQNADAKLSMLPPNTFDGLKREESFILFCKANASILNGMSDFEKFNIFYQLVKMYQLNANYVKELSGWGQYEHYKDKLNANLSLLDTTGRSIQAEEIGGKLLVKFPHADKISNGQRDVLTFATQLQIFRASLREDKRYLLIIDEVFDYLDDANTMAAQYYLSHIVSRNIGNIYIMLLTHLNPYTFRNFVFNPKMINEVYLENTIPTASQEMMDFIAFRTWLDPKKYPERKDTEEKMSSHLFHYNPVAIDMKDEIAGYGRSGVKSTWGKTEVFHQLLIDEMNKYLSGAPQYDPYAVALCFRIRIEKLWYDMLPDSLKDGFIKTHKTNNKLQFCEENSILIPDAIYIVNAIHNESDHLRKNPNTGTFEEKAMVYKLQNNVIKKVVSMSFEYKGIPLELSVIR